MCSHFPCPLYLAQVPWWEGGWLQTGTQGRRVGLRSLGAALCGVPPSRADLGCFPRKVGAALLPSVGGEQPGRLPRRRKGAPQPTGKGGVQSSWHKMRKAPPVLPGLEPDRERVVAPRCTSERHAAGGLGAGERVSGARPERCLLGERQPQCRFGEDGVFHAAAHEGGGGGKGRHDPVLRQVGARVAVRGANEGSQRGRGEKEECSSDLVQCPS